MAKGSPALFASAKRQALRALGQQHPDGFVPDRIWFFNDEDGFIFRLSNLTEDYHVQRIILWPEVERAHVSFVEKYVSMALEDMARAQGEQ